ncbi:MAG: STAS domain-containing protein [Planctomycetota bacterium]|jgi:anti-sigma B factor antagonist
MRIERREESGGVTVLTFSGEFDAFNLPKISEGIDQLIQKGRTLLVFNLKGLKFINSSALGYLIKTHKSLREYDGELVLSEPSKFFETTIATLGIDQIFKIYTNDEEAVKHFHGEGGEEKTEYEGVPVDESMVGSTKLFFKLIDAPENMAVAKILSIYEDGPTFKYPSDPDIDPDELLIGRKLWAKFRQPFLEKERYFECEAEIVMAVDIDNDPHGAAKYRLRYTRMDPADRAALEEFLRGIDDDDLEGGAGVPAPLRPRF